MGHLSLYRVSPDGDTFGGLATHLTGSVLPWEHARQLCGFALNPPPPKPGQKCLVSAGLCVSWMTARPQLGVLPPQGGCHSSCSHCRAAPAAPLVCTPPVILVRAAGIRGEGPSGPHPRRAEETRLTRVCLATER